MCGELVDQAVYRMCGCLLVGVGLVYSWVMGGLEGVKIGVASREGQGELVFCLVFGMHRETGREGGER